MGNSSSSVLEKVANSLEKGQQIDEKALKSLFDKYDKNKNEVLEGEYSTHSPLFNLV